MKFRLKKGIEINGQLDILISENENKFDGGVETIQEVLIHDDPEGLRSLAEQLIYLAELNQEEIDDKHLPVGAREHISLRPNFELSRSSVLTTVGRLDSKVERKFYSSYLPKDESRTKKNKN